jgi:hypothetical protein
MTDAQLKSPQGPPLVDQATPPLQLASVMPAPLQSS